MHEPTPYGFHSPLGLESAHLKSIISHARWLRYLTEQLQGRLGEPASRHCIVANAVGQQLVIMVDSPVWASRLRYQIPEIEQFFSLRFDEFHQCKVKIIVAPAEVQTKKPAIPATPLSRQAAEHIRNTAGSMEDGKLKDALLRLSRRGS